MKNVGRHRNHGHSPALSVLCVVVLSLVSASQALAERVALVIGNASYSSVPVLPNPGNDAAALGATLAGMGFDVDLVLDGNLDSMRMALADFSQTAEGAEMALIFFAGHGMQVAGSNYLLPTDIRLRTREDLVVGALDVNEIFDAFAAADPDTSILILDACRENPFTDQIGVSAGLASGMAPARSVAPRPNAAGTIIAFSAAPGAVASDGVDGNSPYTTALLQWIDRPGIEVGTMLRRVRRTVLELTNGQQVPWVEEALIQDVFLNPGPVPTGPSDGDRIEVALLEGISDLQSEAERGAAQTFYDRFLLASAGGGASDMDSDEMLVRAGLIWLSIRESNDPEVFRAFMDEFPSGDFAMLAEMRIDELSREPVTETLAWLDDLPPVPPRPVQEVAEVTPPQAESPVTETPVAEAPVTEAPEQETGPTPDAVAELQPPQLNQPVGDGDTSISAGGDNAPRDNGQSGLNQSPSTDAPVTPSQEVPAPLPLPPTPEVLEAELGLEPAELEAIQVLLAQSGYYRGGIDGDYGPGTRGAIERLQADTGLNATGYLTVETLRQLVARNAPAVLNEDAAERYHLDVHGVAAIAINGPGAEPEVIRVEAINRNDQVHAYWRDIADGFEADHPGTLVEINHRPGTRYRVELMSILGAEDPPDVLYTWSGGHLAALREAGFARDLTDEMGDGWAFEFKPGALQTYTHEGRIFGVPAHLSLISLYANRSVFEAAGVPLESLQTWEGFLAAIETFQAQGINPIAIGGGDVWPYGTYFSQLAVRLSGQDVVEAAFAGTGDGFDGPTFVDAASEFDRFVALDPFQPGHLEMDEGSAVQMIAEGRAAMAVTGSWRLQRMMWNWTGGPTRMAEELVQLPFPTVGDIPQATTTIGGADGFAVAEEAPDLAVEFVRRLTAIDVQETMTEIVSDIPSMSGADLGIDRPFLRDAADRVLTSTYHQLFIGQALGPDAGEVLTQGIYDVVTEDIPTASVVVAVDQAWDDILADRR